ncbi:MAG TPA: hypothetical protein VN893_02030 [Bryobacteraceae bacterium]|nr:hypothetical protein [Bryobacteraceae bacterium]
MFEQPKTELGLDWRRAVGGVLVLAIAIAIWTSKLFPYVVGAGFVCMILWDVLRLRKRKAALRLMASRRGFEYLGEWIPRALSLRGTPFERASWIWNVIEGDCQGIRVVAFDCTIGSGKASRRRTAIAAHSPRDVFGAVKFSRDLTADRSGDWIILYQPKAIALFEDGLMSVPEVEAHFDAIEVPAP